MSFAAVEALTLRPLSNQACLLAVRAQPGAKRSGLVGVWNGRLKIALRAPAQDGRANAELIKVLADLLGLQRKNLALKSGEKNRLKEIVLPLGIEDARRLLNELLPAK